MAAKTRRIEARVDPADDAAISAAAELTGVSVSSFVVSAARQQADRVLGRAETTLMSSELFDSLVAALDVPDELPVLAAAAAKERVYQRR